MDSLTAAAAGLAPLDPPADWFDDPELDEPTALTVTRDGQVYGHAALWDSCHTGYQGRCVTPPRSRSGYSHFHLGLIETAEGVQLPVGKITLAAGHASTSYGVSEEQARAHYDDSGTVAAFVRAGEDEHGIWLAGAVRSDLPAERLRDLRANPISGDWRGGELIAFHAVPTPGFPVPRAAVRLAASAAEEPLALVASTGLPTVVEEQPRLARPGFGR
jgi:hypothetical protein